MHYASVLILLLLTASCDGDTESEYSRLQAFFRYQGVMTTPELASAMNSPGEFCTITFQVKTYTFLAPNGHATLVPRPAKEAYGRPLYVAGFVVGSPTMPDLGSGLSGQVAYDLACPNCDVTPGVTIALQFADRTHMSCRRCRRTYDLDNRGIVSDGSPGLKLYRYHVQYAQSSDAMIITN